MKLIESHLAVGFDNKGQQGSSKFPQKIGGLATMRSITDLDSVGFGGDKQKLPFTQGKVPW